MTERLDVRLVDGWCRGASRRQHSEEELGPATERVPPLLGDHTDARTHTRTQTLRPPSPILSMRARPQLGRHFEGFLAY